MQSFQHYIPTKVFFGVNHLQDLSSYIKTLGEKPLLLIGKSSARKSGALDQLTELLPGCVVLDGVDENPTDTSCEEASQF